MQSFQWIFQILTVCGCWRPSSWSSPLKKFLYDIYAVFMISIIFLATILQSMDLILNVETQDELSDNIYLTLTMTIGCQKIYSVLTSHKNIIGLTNILKNQPFCPENDEEIEIRRKIDKIALQQTITYLTVVETSVAFYSCCGLLKTDEIKLPYRIWLPYDDLPLSTHIIVYTFQVVASHFCSLVHIACDSLIWTLLIYTCGQLEILGSRLKAIKQQNNQSAKSSANYHNRLYRFAIAINKEFKMIIFVQFMVSTLVVCFTLYMLVTTKDLNEIFLKMILYACSMLVQIFFFCWFGNEVKLKSIEISNAIFESDWTQLDSDTIKILSVIMSRATKSIEFTSLRIVTVNLETFVSILKTSYSAFNVLQSGKG